MMSGTSPITRNEYAMATTLMPTSSTSSSSPGPDSLFYARSGSPASSHDERLGSLDEGDQVSLGYEGVEKTLEIGFYTRNKNTSTTLRDLKLDDWRNIISHAKCDILSVSSNSHFDAYILSESSLFVYPYRVHLKTCGTSTLLRCVGPMARACAEMVSLDIDWLRFSRKNFAFPERQSYPHDSFENECEFALKSLATFDDFKMESRVVGEVSSSDYWNVLSMHRSNRSSRDHVDTSLARVLDVCMHDLDPSVCQIFQLKDNEKGSVSGDPTAVERIHRELHGLLACWSVGGGAFTLDSWMFEPCGFSLNALSDNGSYVTIHVTPESDCSYASFETNADDCSETLMQEVLRFFLPKRASMLALFAESAPNESLNFEFVKPYEKAVETREEFAPESQCIALAINYTQT